MSMIITSHGVVCRLSEAPCSCIDQHSTHREIFKESSLTHSPVLYLWSLVMHDRCPAGNYLTATVN